MILNYLHTHLWRYWAESHTEDRKFVASVSAERLMPRIGREEADNLEHQIEHVQVVCT